jgi:hypothetical protein
MPYRWDEVRQRYLYPSGRMVAPSTVNRALERVIRLGAEWMRGTTEQLQNGTLSLAEWQRRMANEMKQLHTGSAALGRGGWRQMSQSDWGWTGSELRRAYGFLRNFAQDIATGKQALDGRLLTRAAMYADAARGTHRGMQRRMAGLVGKHEERNVLGAADRHCAECVDCSARGWVPIGSLPPVGSRTCLSRCKCHLDFRILPVAAAA